MPETISELKLRPATLDDAALVADLDSLRDPRNHAIRCCFGTGGG